MFRLKRLLTISPSINVRVNFSRFAMASNFRLLPSTLKVINHWQQHAATLKLRAEAAASIHAKAHIDTKPNSNPTVTTARANTQANNPPLISPNSPEWLAEQARRDAQDFLLLDIMPLHAVEANKFVTDHLYRNVPVATAILNLVIDEKTRLSDKDKTNLTQQEKEFLKNPQKTLFDLNLYYNVTRAIQNDPKLTQSQKDEKINAFKKDISLDNAAKLLGKDKNEIQKFIDNEISKAQNEAKLHLYQKPNYFGLDPTSTAKQSHDLYQVIDKFREQLGQTHDAKVQIKIRLSAIGGDLYIPYADGDKNKNSFEYYASSYPNAGGNGKDNKGEKLQGGGRQVMASKISKDDMQISINPSK